MLLLILPDEIPVPDWTLLKILGAEAPFFNGLKSGLVN
jgi:hypothetical protein